MEFNSDAKYNLSEFQNKLHRPDDGLDGRSEEISSHLFVAQNKTIWHTVKTVEVVAKTGGDGSGETHPNVVTERTYEADAKLFRSDQRVGITGSFFNIKIPKINVLDGDYSISWCHHLVNNIVVKGSIYVNGKKWQKHTSLVYDIFGQYMRETPKKIMIKDMGNDQGWDTVLEPRTLYLEDKWFFHATPIFHGKPFDVKDAKITFVYKYNLDLTKLIRIKDNITQNMVPYSSDMVSISNEASPRFYLRYTPYDDFYQIPTSPYFVDDYIVLTPQDSVNGTGTAAHGPVSRSHVFCIENYWPIKCIFIVSQNPEDIAVNNHSVYSDVESVSFYRKIKNEKTYFFRDLTVSDFRCYMSCLPSYPFKEGYLALPLSSDPFSSDLQSGTCIGNFITRDDEIFSTAPSNFLEIRSDNNVRVIIVITKETTL